VTPARARAQAGARNPDAASRVAVVAVHEEFRVMDSDAGGWLWLVSRFRSSPHLADLSDANFGIEGHQ
jgi:hypothetical protein